MSIRRVLITALGLAAVMPSSAQASDIIYGTTSTSLVRFNASSPGTIDATVPISGLPGGVTVSGLDQRPISESLYILGSDGMLYRLSKTTGVASVVGATGLAATITLTGGVAIDFNPTNDRLRVVTSDDQNLRQNPNTGAAVDGNAGMGGVQPDTPISAAAAIAGVGYDRNALGLSATTLFAIDEAGDQLGRIGSVDGTPSSPNLGVYTPLGPVGKDVTVDADLDVAPGGTLYASLPAAGGGATVLARLDPATGTATDLGAIGAPVTHIAVADGPRIVYTTRSGTLVEVPGDDPAAAKDVVALQVPGGSTITDLEVRPATGDLLTLSSQGIISRVDRATGALTPLGQPGATSPVAAEAGFDVDPLTDKARVAFEPNHNVTLSPFSTPFTTTTGTDFNYAGGDPNQGANPAFIATAFSTPSGGTIRSYGIDTALKTLVEEVAPGSGTLNTTTALGISATLATGAWLDFANRVEGWAVMRPTGNPARLYWIRDTTSPILTNAVPSVDLGELRVAGSPSTAFVGAAIATTGTASVPEAVVEAESDDVARVVVSRTLDRGVANVEYDVAAETASAGTDVSVASGTVTFENGQRLATIEIPLIDDADVESPETFTVQLARPGGAVALGAATSTRVTILSDDPAAAPPVPAPQVITVTVEAPPKPDTIKPVGLLSITPPRLGPFRARGMAFRLLASEAGTARVVGTVTSAVRRRLKLRSATVTGTVRTTFSGPQAKTVRLLLTAAAKSKLARTRLLPLTVTATLTDRAGNVATVKQTVTLRR